MTLIKPEALVDLGEAAHKARVDLRIDLIYADAAHPLNQTFATAIYRPGARLRLYCDLADIVLAAGRAANAQGLRLVATDGLRTTEAQARMAQTPRVRANPHWTQPGPGMLISPPGAGAHPRGMAVDVMIETLAGKVLDMGCALDYFSPDPADNPAARNYPVSDDVRANRAWLDAVMAAGALACGKELCPLPSEWWDYRLPRDIYESHAPLSDADLPENMRMCS
ncbi:MAG: D-Ala-D-Ala dipeptidase [Rhodospirillales bacterium]|nr:D-Ala-D-Ala dipeptidase [Alphaproteobacteria bacterium]MCB9986355.1 D-Ala-D-Ala dipeptidase [Rhodospirillales bacterium]USO07096.1 MAG: D-Ala-D-Ala dipeptidase [Rhodospirillales bacterium]